MSYDVCFRNLASLTSECAIEMDRYVQGRDYNPVPLQRFNQTLSDLQLRDTDDFMTSNNVDFHMAIYEVVRRGSNKPLQRWSDLALEMKLLRMELETATESKEKGAWARSMLVNLSGEFSARVEPLRHYMVA